VSKSVESAFAFLLDDKTPSFSQPTPPAGSIDSLGIVLVLAILPSSKHDYIRNDPAHLHLAMCPLRGSCGTSTSIRSRIRHQSSVDAPFGPSP
jgi:hypothetical protein